MGAEPRISRDLCGDARTTKREAAHGSRPPRAPRPAAFQRQRPRAGGTCRSPSPAKQWDCPILLAVIPGPSSCGRPLAAADRAERL